jgi:hypothetical protein
MMAIDFCSAALNSSMNARAGSAENHPLFERKETMVMKIGLGCLAAVALLAGQAYAGHGSCCGESTAVSSGSEGSFTTTSSGACHEGSEIRTEVGTAGETATIEGSPVSPGYQTTACTKCGETTTTAAPPATCAPCKKVHKCHRCCLCNLCRLCHRRPKCSTCVEKTSCSSCTRGVSYTETASARPHPSIVYTTATVMRTPVRWVAGG